MPSSYVRSTYSYSSAYNPRQPFVIPIGLPHHLHSRMLQASSAFRVFDRDYSGYLDKKEFKKAMRHLGVAFNKGDCKRLFWMVDTDRSGRISERGKNFFINFLLFFFIIIFFCCLF